jgi:hypothetical protein
MLLFSYQVKNGAANKWCMCRDAEEAVARNSALIA